MMKKTTIVITQNPKVQRLDTYISLNSSLTRSHIQRLIRQGLVHVNSRIEKPGYTVREGDRIEFAVPDEEEGALAPEDIPLDIRYEDEYMIVVNKPPGMVMYPSLGHASGTLMNAVVSVCGKLSSVGAPLRPGVVHRLDKDTSGLIVIARDDQAHHDLVKQFKERTVEKYYMTLLYGNLKADHGEIKTLIGRSASSRKKMSARPRSGKEAVTQYKVIRRFRFATEVQVRIITGRTHQIRVHFASVGNPVLGDSTYGRKTSVTLAQRTISFPRQMLHAYSLKLKHPVSGEVLEFNAPLPEDMRKAIGEMEELQRT